MKHGSILNGNIRLSRVSSQWKSTVESVERAKHAGCAEVLVWGESDLVESVSHISGGRMADVVFDGIGRLTFETSLKSLRTRGTMVSIGASSGVPDPVPLAALNAKSLFLTRPGLGAHITDLAEYKERARDVYDALATKIIVPATATVFPLAEASKAHIAIESGAASGPVVLVP
ncbi:zinc-binding dehydrogenase [Rhizobium sp. SAFR-030]|uniref:zinc-binding dehydrogenase n=1 Tax=Rhizobium sp. SAFR-030 TaxID=3387277 RepID=UPI003F816023